MNPYIPQVPTLPQKRFLALDSLTGFYGGAGGGGKSSALLMAALMYVQVPGYAALILRRTFTDLALPEALMDRAQQWLRGTDARWSAIEKTWHIAPDGRLVFGYLENPGDLGRYDSSAFQFIGLDEMTQFPREHYTYMFRRLRGPRGFPVPLRMRGASNPGGRGHEWVKDEFHLGKPGEGVNFVPARLDDNPYIDQVGYRKSLAMLDPISRRQILDGDWTARRAGAIFCREKFLVLTARPAGMRLVRFWDLGATAGGGDPTAGVLLGMAAGTFAVCDVRRIRGNPATVEKLVAQTAALDGRGVQVRIEQEPGASGKSTISHYQRNILPGYDVRGIPWTGDKFTRAGPVSSAVDAGNVSLVAGPWVEAFLEELEAFPTDGVPDDQVDGLSGAFFCLTGQAPVAYWRA